MLVDNLDEMYRKDLTVTDTGIRVVALAGATKAGRGTSWEFQFDP
jgi:hypothetical protein